jgi:hypothetical protein
VKTQKGGMRSKMGIKVRKFSQVQQEEHGKKLRSFGKTHREDEKFSQGQKEEHGKKLRSFGKTHREDAFTGGMHKVKILKEEGEITATHINTFISISSMSNIKLRIFLVIH